MRDKKAALVLAAAIIGSGLGLWSASTASACTAEMGCTTTVPPRTTAPYQTTPPPPSNPHQTTAPPQTNPTATNPPQQRTNTTHAPVTDAPRHTTGTAAPVLNQGPIDQTIADQTPADVAPAPAIALSGTPPPVGGGVASSSPKPPDTSSSGAGTVLWAFGIGLGALGIAIGARVAFGGGGPSSPQPLQPA
jgi:hypothetical protein